MPCRGLDRRATARVESCRHRRERGAPCGRAWPWSSRSRDPADECSTRGVAVRRAGRRRGSAAASAARGRTNTARCRRRGPVRLSGRRSPVVLTAGRPARRRGPPPLAQFGAKRLSGGIATHPCQLHKERPVRVFAHPPRPVEKHRSS